MKTIILAGGSGSRLWPLSTLDTPKQFMKILHHKSLLQLAFERALFVQGGKFKDIFINTNHIFQKKIIKNLDLFDMKQIIAEPVKKNTAPAIALVIKYLEQFCNKDEILLFMPSDHFIKPLDRFNEYVSYAKKSAKEGNIVVFGISPNTPDTGYGYINVNKTEKNIYSVRSFTEKPDLATAQSYLLSENYFWNSGIFMFTIETIKSAFKKHRSNIGNYMDVSYEDFFDNFKNLTSISIDYAIMEKVKNVKLVPMNLFWSDVGTWDSIYLNGNKDENKNLIQGNVKIKNVHNSLIRNTSSHPLIANDLENIIWIKTDKESYLTQLGKSQNIKAIC